jgi:hypothetical protein
MSTLYRLTQAECEAVAGGAGGQIVAVTNHNSGFFGAAASPNASAGPGFFLHQFGGRVVSGVVDLVQDLAPPK